MLDGLTWRMPRLPIARSAGGAGGLGECPENDCRASPTVTLLEAMRAAEDRDRIAWNYTHGFADIFDLGLTGSSGGLARWGDVPWVTTYVYLGIPRPYPRHPDRAEVRRQRRKRRCATKRGRIEAGLSQSAALDEMAARSPLSTAP